MASIKYLLRTFDEQGQALADVVIVPIDLNDLSFHAQAVYSSFDMGGYVWLCHYSAVNDSSPALPDKLRLRVLMHRTEDRLTMEQVIDHMLSQYGQREKVLKIIQENE